MRTSILSASFIHPHNIHTVTDRVTLCLPSQGYRGQCLLLLRCCRRGGVGGLTARIEAAGPAPGRVLLLRCRGRRVRQPGQWSAGPGHECRPVLCSSSAKSRRLLLQHLCFPHDKLIFAEPYTLWDPAANGLIAGLVLVFDAGPPARPLASIGIPGLLRPHQVRHGRCGRCIRCGQGALSPPRGAGVPQPQAGCPQAGGPQAGGPGRRRRVGRDPSGTRRRGGMFSLQGLQIRCGIHPAFSSGASTLRPGTRVCIMLASYGSRAIVRFREREVQMFEH